MQKILNLKESLEVRRTVALEVFDEVRCHP